MLLFLTRTVMSLAAVISPDTYLICPLTKKGEESQNKHLSGKSLSLLPTVAWP